MSENTKIQWTDHTFNPWMGCTKVSPGCANCYAEVSTPSRARGIKWGKGQPRQRTSESNWKEPLRWNEQAAGKATRPRVFCASLADWLDDEVPIEWLAGLLKLIHDTPNLDWQLLTKRPENFLDRMAKLAVGAVATTIDAERMNFKTAGDFAYSWAIKKVAPQNVWIGTTVEDQQRAEERIPRLLTIPAKVRFLSVEPMLGPIEFRGIAIPILAGAPGVHWVIVGGESGSKARPCNVAWIRDVVGQCTEARVACFVKQFGTHPVITTFSGNMGIRPENKRAFLSKLSLKHPKGGDPDEWPEDLRVRQFPDSCHLK